MRQSNYPRNIMSAEVLSLKRTGQKEKELKLKIHEWSNVLLGMILDTSRQWLETDSRHIKTECFYISIYWTHLFFQDTARNNDHTPNLVFLKEWYLCDLELVILSLFPLSLSDHSLVAMIFSWARRLWDQLLSPAKSLVAIWNREVSEV